MTRDDAVKIWLLHGSSRVDEVYRRRVPQHIADRDIAANAEDCIDGLIALGILRVEPDAPADVLQERGTP
jgi:hypothetical protein